MMSRQRHWIISRSRKATDRRGAPTCAPAFTRDRGRHPGLPLRFRELLIIAITGLLATLAGGALAQEKQSERPQPPAERRGPAGRGDGEGRDQGRRPSPPDPTFSFVESEMRLGGKTVKGAPYSATVTTEDVQTLSNGTRISRKTTASVYRDSEGRTRREQTLSAIGPFAAAGEAPQMIFLHDPVAGVQYVLDPRDRTARKMKLWSGPPPEHRPPSSAQAKEESLGKQTLEGVEAEGTRSTLTIPAGQIGNDRPLEIVSERWYSPALQVVLLSKHSDPRMGEHVYRLTNIQRSEPAHSLFEVPPDYTVKEKSYTHGPGMKGMRRPDHD